MVSEPTMPTQPAPKPVSVKDTPGMRAALTFVALALVGILAPRPATALCDATSVQPSTALANAEITIAGTGLNVGCKVLFESTPDAAPIDARTQAVNAYTLKAWVPAGLAPGGWRLRVVPAQQTIFAFTVQAPPATPASGTAAPGGGGTTSAAPTGQPATPPAATTSGGACEMQSVAPAIAPPDTEVRVSGRELGTTCMVVFVDRTGRSVEARAEVVSSFVMKAWVPAGVESGPGKVSIRPRNSTKGAPGVAFVVQGQPCEVLAATPPAAEAEDEVTLAGTNFLSWGCAAWFKDGAGRSLRADMGSRVVDQTHMVVAVPPGAAPGTGSVWGQHVNPSGKGHPLVPFQIKPSAPFLMQRQDLSDTRPHMQAYIAGSGKGTYRGPGFEAMVQVSVWRTGGKYFYEYSINRRVGDLRYIVTPWVYAASNQPGLIYGVLNPATGQYITPEISKRWGIRWTSSKPDLDWLTVYFQSTRPPVPQKIYLDGSGQSIGADGFVPQP